MKLDGHITCHRCGASAHDVIDERKGQLNMECCFCGAMEWCKAPFPKTDWNEPAAEKGEFRFKFGRFTGKTFSEVEVMPNGRNYLEWIAANNEVLRDRVNEYLKRSTVSAAAAIVPAASVAKPESGDITPAS